MSLQSWLSRECGLLGSRSAGTTTLPPVQPMCALHRSREHMSREESGRGSRRAR
ncbi:hypothetical protein K523DRAFT_422365 [Schizophyllum commune Tattone D]|nr:hypothetical protein K523DRAFT_422365 [Schizophyllum commune Tattone D]